MAVGGEGLGLKPAGGFESYLAAIGGEHGFNNAIFRAICSYVGSHGVEATDPVALRERLREAVLAAPPDDPQPSRDRALCLGPLPRRRDQTRPGPQGSGAAAG